MTTGIHVIVHEDTDHAIVVPQGRIYFDTFEPLRDALLVLASRERPRIVLDLSQVPICDSSGLNLFAQAHRLASRHDGWLRLVAPQAGVRRVLDATNLTRLLQIYDTVEAALV